MAFIAEQAGGCASDGISDLLDIVPHTLHQKTPCFIGDRNLVRLAEDYIAKYDQEWIEAFRPYRERSRVTV